MTDHFAKKLTTGPSNNPSTVPTQRPSPSHEEIKKPQVRQPPPKLRKQQPMTTQLKVSHKELQPMIRSKKDLFSILSKEGKHPLFGDSLSLTLNTM